MELAIVKTGVANTASVTAAFERLGCKPNLTNNASVIHTAKYLVLPGVGTFGATMHALSQNKLIEPLRERIKERKPTLAICVGLQVLFKSSEETPGIRGLGIFSGSIKKFPPFVRVPQLGWNWIEGESFFNNGYGYFANSYYASEILPNFKQAWSEHGVRFLSGFKGEGLTACQFHPELSGEFGKKVLTDWLKA